jgi:peptidoglycan L-alanyl-D-glutamate endopeptidase CwlK
MSNLVEITKALQGELGVTRDGKAGLVTLSAALATIRGLRMDCAEEKEGPARTSEGMRFDDRTEKYLSGLDPKAVPIFREFICLAKGTAATMGCDYIMIAGNRTWAEQDALFAQGRTAPGNIVTKARGGSSNHNFGIAADFGVFAGKAYLDDSNPRRASAVHKACAFHAASCGLEWGGDWQRFRDEPHYEIQTGLTMAQKRNVFKLRGSVL